MRRTKIGKYGGPFMFTKWKYFVITVLLVGVILYVCIYDVMNEMSTVGLVSNDEVDVDRLVVPVVDDDYFKDDFFTEKDWRRVLNAGYVKIPTIGQKTLDAIQKTTNCTDKPLESKLYKNKQYLVFQNYAKASKSFRCHESITLTTHCDYSFIHNLYPLVEKWKGPISVAIYAPGSDFRKTTESISYMRNCGNDLIRELVTFHVYFSQKHIPDENLWFESDAASKSRINCSSLPPFVDVSRKDMYKNRNQLLYPVNIGRNIARSAAQTHFILSSDIDLYPSLNVIPSFLDLIAEQPDLVKSKWPKVFPLNIFEIDHHQSVPENKTSLLQMLNAGTAIYFHKNLCSNCITIPHYDEWILNKETHSLNVFEPVKRSGSYSSWEPVFIGTNSDPIFDERLSWEGMKERRIQGFRMCVLGYDFMVLDNAFLVHRPGVKIFNESLERQRLMRATNGFIHGVIVPEITQRVFYDSYHCRV